MPQSPGLKLFRRRTFIPLCVLLALTFAFASFMASKEIHAVRTPTTIVTEKLWVAMDTTHDVAGTLLQAFECDRVQVWVIVNDEPLPKGTERQLVRVETDGRKHEQRGVLHFLP